MNKTSKIFYDIVLTCVSLLLLIVIVGVCVGYLILPDERNYADTSMESYNENWERVYKDRNAEPIEIPSVQAVHSGEDLVVQNKLNIWTDKDCFLSFSSVKQDITVYVEDELRYEYSTADTRAFGSASPDIMLMVPLHPSDNGKTLTIVFSGDNNYTGVLGEFSIGTQLAVVYSIFKSEEIEVIFALGLMFLGFIAAALGFFIRNVYKMDASVGFIGWGIFMAGLWVVSESPFRQFLFSNISLASYVTFLSTMLMAPLFALYFDSLQNGRYRAIYLLICVFSIVECVISLVLQFSAGVDLVNSLKYSFMLFVADTVVYIITVIPDFYNHKVKEYFLEFVGICGALLAAAVQLIVYFRKPINLDGRILCFGLLFLLSMATIRAFNDILSLEREKSAAVQASRASTEFLARMSHEMRTPINAILGMNKMILKESGEQKILEYARDVNSAGNNLLGIVNEVLDLAKVSSGNIDIEPKTYSLMEMVRNCYAMVIPRAKASRLSLVVEMDDVLPSMLYGDQERLEQVIINLLTNAVKYTPSGRVTFAVNGKVTEGRLMLIISVTDTGIGIKESSMPYLFESYKRVDNFLDEKKIEGTGLGLAITKQLVELMDGKITVESTYGKGSNFTVVIPQGIRSVEPVGTFSMGPNGDRRVMDRNQPLDLNGNILVVDDVAINLRVFTMLLKDTHINIDTARSGQETLEKITKNKYDMIFLDHLMPGMSGVETKNIMDRLDTNLNKDTPVIMQTANAIVGAKDDYMKMGFADYIAKPLKEEELVVMLRKYLQ